MSETPDLLFLGRGLDEPTPEPTNTRTDSDMLKEIFEQYPTAEEAKKHVNEVAKGENKFNRKFSKPNCYKAIKKKCNFKGDKPKVSSHEATASIPEGEEIELPIEPDTPTQTTSTHFEDESGIPEPQPYNQPFTNYEAVKAELQPIQERSVKGLVNNVFDMIGVKGEGKNGVGITDQESKDTITLLPYILKKITKGEMNQETYENLTIGLHVGNIATKAIKSKVADRTNKELKKIFAEQPTTTQKITPAPQPAPAPEPKPEQTPETKPEQPAINITSNDSRNTPFLKAMEKMQH